MRLLRHQVPIEVSNELTATKKTVHLVGGFGGVHQTEADADGIVAYRPQLSMIVHWDGAQEPLTAGGAPAADVGHDDSERRVGSDVELDLDDILAAARDG